MRTAFLILIPCCLFAGCSGEDSPATGSESNAAGNTTAETTSLEPGDLEKLGSWDATSKASAVLTAMLADIMAEVKDKDTAAAAIPKLRKLAPKFAAVNRAEKALGEPSKEDRTLVLKNLAEAHKKFDAAYVPLMDNEELKEIVSDAIDDAYVGNVSE